MKLWLLTRTDKVGWDEYEAFVIAADTETEARDKAALNSADEASSVWEGQLTCDATCIAEETNQEAGVVLGRYNAG